MARWHRPEPKYLVYGLIDPRTGELRYVGRSSTGLARARQRHSALCGSWETSLKKQGLRKVIEVLEACPHPHVERLDEQTDRWLDDTEVFWIASVRASGAKLLNANEGGRRGRPVSQETREKQRAAKLGQKFGPRSPEAMENMRAAGLLRRGSRASQETREKMSRNRTGRKQSQETKNRRAASLMGRKRPEVGKKVGDILRKPVVRVEDGVQFKGALDAAQASGVSVTSVRKSIYLGKTVIGHTFAYTERS